MILAAAALCGVREVLRMGGAHAIAALAYGTASVRRADVIAGPGSLYVQEAKRLVARDVGIDGFYGPSDVLVLASAGARAELVAADLLAQAEHGAGTVVCAVSDDAALLDAVAARADRAGTGEAACALVRRARRWRLRWPSPRRSRPSTWSWWAPAPRRSRRACAAPAASSSGAASGVAFGDYVAGSNHALPTGGAARFASGLSVRAFRRRMSEVRIGAAAPALAVAGAPIARAEGFPGHAASMEVRENGSGDGG